MTRDTDLIRRGDAIKAVTDADRDCRGAHGARENIAAIPAVSTQEPPSPAPILRLSIERKIGMYGSVYDGPHDARAYTYKHQPGNLPAWEIGQAASVAAKDPAGDYIDSGLSLLRHLQDAGFGVFTLVDGEAATPAPVVPAEGLDALVVECVEMEDWSLGYAHPADPIWRIVINRQCADFPSETAARNFAAQIAALRSAPPVGARVKPLAFEGHNGFWRTNDGIGGFFEVTEVNGAFHMCRIVHGHANKLIPYATREDAFFACQVEHDRRIRAALLPAGEGVE